MMHTRFLALLATVLLASCTQAPPEQQIVNDAAAALGGAERIFAVRTLVIEGDGTQYNLGKDVTPEAHGQTFAITDLKQAIDVAGSRMRVEMTRRPNFAYFQGPQPQRQVNGIDGQVGYNVAPNGAATRVPDGGATERRIRILHHPITALRS